MSDQYTNDDFEKVEPESDAYQDENITSTSMSGGDMAEEDEYVSGNSAQNDLDMFSAAVPGEFVPTSTGPKTPLISFDQPLEPTAPSPPVFSDSVSGVKAEPSEGCWVKNVDPRDGLEDMGAKEAASPNLSEPMAQSETSLNPFVGDSVNERPKITLDNKKSEAGLISDTDSVVSDSSEYSSSSGDKSDLESSESETSEVTRNVKEKHIPTVNSAPDTSLLCYQQNLVQDMDRLSNYAVASGNKDQTENVSDDFPLDDKDAIYSNNIKEQEKQLSALESEAISKMEDESEDVGKLVDAVSFPGPFIEENTLIYENESLTMNSDSNLAALNCQENPTAVFETEPVNECITDDVFGIDKELKNTNDKQSTASVDELATPSFKDTEIVQSKDNNMAIEGNTKGNETASLSEVQGSVMLGISETDLSDVLEKLTNEPEIVEDTSPVGLEADGYLKESSGSPYSCSDVSDSESEDECSVDSDISGDEGVSGTWNPSPLYSFDIGEEDEDEDDESGVNNELESQNSDTVSPTVDDDNKLNELREDVKDLMEQMESLVNQEPIEERDTLVKKEDLDGSKIEVVGAASTVQSSFKQSAKGKKRSNGYDVEPDLLHVHFKSPTNMLFYDPESPIIERVSAEVQNDLLDIDELKDEDEKETPTDETKAELQAEVVKDLKDIYDKIGATKEAGYGEAESVKKEGPGEEDLMENRMESKADPSVFNLYKRKQDDKEDEEVVLRKKNNRNAATELHRNTGITERECDSMIIHNLTQNEPAEEKEQIQIVEEAMKLDKTPSDVLRSPGLFEAASVVDDDGSEMKTSTDSMIIHDDEETDDVSENNLHEIPEQFNNIRKEEPEQTKKSHSDDFINKSKKVQSFIEFEEEKLKNLDKKVDEEIKEENSIKLHQSEDLDLSSRSMQKEVIVGNNQDLEHDYICDSDSESMEENSPFDVSNNDTIVEAESVTTEIPCNPKRESTDINNIAEESSVTSVDTGFELDDSYQIRQTTNINSMKETVETNQSINLGSNVNSDKQATGTDDRKRNHWELILQVMEQVLDLIYWRDVKKTGVVFGSMLFILLSLSICSLMSVLAYLSLAILTVTLSFRIYKNVMQAVQKTNEGHPFKNLLQMDIELSEDVVKNAADKIASNINNCAKELRRLYLVEDYVDTLKFGLLLWLLTYIGGWFNGMTLIILTVVSIFTLPKVYETYKVPIDQNVNMVRSNLNNIMAQVSAKMPFPKKKAKVN